MTDWTPASLAAVDGTLCALRFRDRLGTFEDKGPFFLHDDGYWYRVDPPTQMKAFPSYYRPLEIGE